MLGAILIKFDDDFMAAVSIGKKETDGYNAIEATRSPNRESCLEKYAAGLRLAVSLVKARERKSRGKKNKEMYANMAEVFERMYGIREPNEPAVAVRIGDRWYLAFKSSSSRAFLVLPMIWADNILDLGLLYLAEAIENEPDKVVDAIVEIAADRSENQ